MSRSARFASLLVVLAAGLASPAEAQQTPANDAPLQIYGSPLAINASALPIDAPVDSLDGSVSFHDVGVVLQADVLFAFNSSRLTGKATSRIAQAVANLHKRHPHALQIQGYTDSIGTPAYNLGLSQRRAQAVLKALRNALGAGAPPMTAVGYGEADPVAANANPDGSDNPRGRALNRRVEIHYVG